MQIGQTAASPPFPGLERLHLVMGWQCNVRCSMCYQTDFSPKFNMGAEIYARKLIDAYPHISHVKLQGGEPTIMKNCRDVAVLLRNYPRVALQIASNGVHVDDFWHGTFVEQSDCVSFSINAATRESYDRIVRYGNFGNVVRSIERLTATRRNQTPAVGITAVIVPDNVRELHRIITLASTLGADYVEFLTDPILSYAGLPDLATVIAELERCREAVARTSLPAEGLDTFRRRLGPICDDGTGAQDRSRVCPAPFRTLVVDPDGACRVCCNTWVKIGDLTESSLADLWQSPAAKKFRRMMSTGSYLWCSPDCSDNANPSGWALPHKYWYQARHEPAACVQKALHKLQQVGTRDSDVHPLTFRRAS